MLLVAPDTVTAETTPLSLQDSLPIYHKLNSTSNKRSINRHNWDYEQLNSLLANDTTIHSKAFTQLKHIISLRKKQIAFHPNATQFTMHINDSIFAFWRQSQSRYQSIFCIYNITNQPQSIALKDINLVELDDWHDLISGHKYKDPRELIILQAYEYVWITNN